MILTYLKTYFGLDWGIFQGYIKELGDIFLVQFYSARMKSVIYGFSLISQARVEVGVSP